VYVHKEKNSLKTPLKNITFPYKKNYADLPDYLKVVQTLFCDNADK